MKLTFLRRTFYVCISITMFGIDTMFGIEIEISVQ